jgi:ubiquinone/menaquinone biosynthesis C-methylase UbiE
MPTKRRLIDYVSAKGEISILDIGMGQAKWWNNFPKVNFSGIDTSIKMVNYTKKIYPNTIVHEGSAEQLPFQDQTFDLVVMAHVLSVIDNPKQAYLEAKRVTKDDGEIIIINHDSKNWKWIDIPLSWFSRLAGVKLPFYLEDIIPNNTKIISSNSIGVFKYFTFLRLK